MSEKHYTIGLANLSENHPFSITVRESLEAAAAQRPDVTVIARDNDLNSEKALANVAELAAIPVDLAIIFHIDERVGPNLRNMLMAKRIPVVAIDIPIPMTVFFGIHNRNAGLIAGEALGAWVQKHWDGQVDRVLAMTEPRVLEIVRQRVDFALVKLSEILHYDPNIVFYVDSGNTRDFSRERAREVLKRWDDLHRIAVVSFNDDSALGVLDAAREQGREQDLAVVGQGANLAIPEFRDNPQSRLIASTAYYPENYGPALLDLALRMLNGERVPRDNYIEPVLVTPENYTDAGG